MRIKRMAIFDAMKIMKVSSEDEKSINNSDRVIWKKIDVFLGKILASNLEQYRSLAALSKISNDPVFVIKEISQVFPLAFSTSTVFPNMKGSFCYKSSLKVNKVERDLEKSFKNDENSITQVLFEIVVIIGIDVKKFLLD